MAYSILSLDGGGSWALLQAMALMNIYPDKSTKEILAKFDLVTANSGGSLMLACMIEFDDMQQVLGTFLDEDVRKSVFSKLQTGERNFTEWGAELAGFGPRYKTSRKITGIEKTLQKYGKESFSGLPKRHGMNTQFLITAYDFDNQRAVYFRSDTAASGGVAYEETLAQVVHASSNAPINYFDEPATFRYQNLDRRFWDGGVGGNNNPALVGVVEAMGAYGKKPAEIKLLSIGTGNVNLPIEGLTNYVASKDFLVQKKQDSTLKNDILKMTDCILQEPTDAATYMSHIVLGGNAVTGNTPKIVRLNPLVQPYADIANGQWMLPPDFKEDFFEKLTKLDMDAVEQDEVNLISYLGAMWVADKVKNQPIRANGKTLEVEIGYSVFSQGKTAWLLNMENILVQNN